jgi:hypothetical protein
MEWREKLTRRWLNFTKTWNGQTASAVVKRIVRDGIGKLILVQPADAWRDTRCLSTAGKSDQYRDSTGWDWYQMVGCFQRECEEKGVELIVKKHGQKSFSGAKAIQGKTRKAATKDQVQVTRK